MADRFPSLEEFDSGAQTQAQPSSGFESADTSDFLSREKALLGEDADQFATSNDNAAFVEDGDDDLLGGGGEYSSGHHGGEEVTEFESSFPAIDTRNEAVAPGGTITSSNYNTPSFADEEEPDVIKAWRERRNLALQEREKLASERKAETIKTAQQNIDDFYENYNSKKEKTVAQSRREAEDFLNAREDTSAGGTSWERIAKLVDLSGKGARGGGTGTDKAKFRELLLSLRKDEKAPGATGY